ncbi:MAG: rhomboid family intramembrane serine protease [Bacteroidetes bacterium]|nr:rhomboid family intramembrane serine protease [Bacteroidota bacterium]
MSLFRSIWEDLRYSLRAGNIVTKLVVINFAVFVAFNLLYVLYKLLHLELLTHTEYWTCVYWFSLSADWRLILWRPWTILTHAFVQTDIWHLLNNLMGMYLFGVIVSDLLGARRVLPLYLLGAFAGALVFFISSNLTHYGDIAYGASAAVMALAGASLIMAPDYQVALFFLGEVKIKYIVLIFVLLDMVGVANANMTLMGSPAGHMGGFAFGILYVYRLRDGKDMAEPVNRFIERLLALLNGDWNRRKKNKQFKPKTAIKAAMPRPKGNNASDTEDASYQEKLDAILEKIKQTGYDNLTQTEKDFLYEASKK